MSNDQKLEAKYGLFTAISMVIGQVIGSGIFFKVDDVLLSTQGNVLAGLFGFLIVGISVVFAGISMANYAELLPKDGGILNYVNYRFGESASYFVGWIYMSLFYPSLTAVLFTVSGIYIAHLLAEFMNFEPTFLHFALIGFVNLIIFFFINIFRPKSSGIFQQMTTVLKVLPLIFIASLGILSLFKGEVSEVNTFTQMGSGLQNQSFILLVAASFIPISFAFDGWYIATQISGEIKNSSKNLPKALIIGTVSVMVIYIAYYLGIVFRMSGEEIIQLKDTYITEFARKAASNSGAILMQLFIIISVLGTSNGLLLATIRVPYQFSNLEKSKKFLNLNKVDEKTKMPVNSAIFGTSCIVFYLAIYYLTNTNSFFTEKNFDLSAIPIIFIYLVNGSLFLGLFQLFRKKVFSRNSFLKKIITVIAVLGNTVVLFGTATAPNGITYFIINLLFIGAGFLLMKRN
ncbi:MULTISPECIES: APC family permease [unclassified Kaistella]|uniref:APC family permease n=1 Tax=unclassified Kaistella TaxID=2762626 RepID=UPI002736DD29|nr:MULTISPECIES: APC family permease [unclassified Kaistella]MDP2453701.1 APC family permease [Kaistella sp. SH11-4b]MDP2456758.1 APC family permease [Kaistella sp. SH40-3]MDP2459514.1 APC family permease [Kaistella sp. SH19-2b]